MNRKLNNQETKTYLCYTIDRLQTFLKPNKCTPKVWTLTKYIHNLNYFKGLPKKIENNLRVLLTNKYSQSIV